MRHSYGGKPRSRSASGTRSRSGTGRRPRRATSNREGLVRSTSASKLGKSMQIEEEGFNTNTGEPYVGFYGSTPDDPYIDNSVRTEDMNFY